MAEEKRQLSLQATEEEVRLFELIKEHYQRKSDSDMIRFLIIQESKKILNQNTAMAVNSKGR